MRAKEYLLQIRTKKDRIRQLEGTIQEMRQMSAVPPIDPSAEHLSSNPCTTSPQERVVMKLTELTEQLWTMIADSMEFISIASEQIKNMDNPVYSKILFHRYVQGWRLERIACEMNYSYERIRHLHGLALLGFENKYFK